ncbi:MAG: methyl-accepting chemotaxis protein [Pseudomonadota bacterium]|nr:methyl-accepting chemotaxis protein [Pseudomonadota bacterium]
MGLVKRSTIAGAVKTSPKPATNSRPSPAKPAARKTVPRASHDTATERIAAATEQLASGLSQSAAATRELAKSMEQIAAGAQEAASASQEQSRAVRQVVADLATARNEAEASSRRTDALAVLLAEAAGQISASTRAIGRSAQRQTESVQTVKELDLRAQDIGEITRTVSRISDQTNLLALNAAIEAARAGDLGRGFAVVADEVRTLAEISDRNAREVQKLSESVQQDVTEVGSLLTTAAGNALREAQTAASTARDLEARKEDVARIAEGSREILMTALEAERAASEALKGAEQISAAAEEQSSAVTEVQTAVEQQAQSLDQGQVAAQGLAAVAEQLRSSKRHDSSVEQVSASAEELSASIQEMSGAAAQVMAAIDQISKASQLQSAAAQETSAALVQIEKSARLARQNSNAANGRVQELDGALGTGRKAIASLLDGVSAGVTSTQSSLAMISRLEGVARRIEKFVEAIALVAVQTGMLAVSGSVEAARAGEAGRGFAVVSNDIRSLAREATENIERARDSVRSILDQITALRSSCEQVLAVTEAEAQNSHSVTAGLQKVEDEVAALGSANSTILQGADRILLAASEVAAASRQIAAAAEEGNAAAREAATAATEQSRGVEDLAAAVEEIASLAGELNPRRA